MMVLLDAIGTLAECVGSTIDKSLFYDKIMDPLVKLLIHVNDRHDPVIIATFECLSCVCLAIPQGTSLIIHLAAPLEEELELMERKSN